MLGKFHDFYPVLLRRLLEGGIEEVNQRTQRKIMVCPGAVSFNVDLTESLLPTCGVRRTYPRTAAIETAWYISGSRDVGFLRHRNVKIWDKFVEDDGFTIANAYGYRWRHAFGRDQLGDAIRLLRNNPSDRQVVVTTWDPAQDGLDRSAKNVPCPVMFTLNVIGGRLYSTMLLRSSDVFVGLPYDVMGHSLLVTAIAASLGLHLGTVTFTLAHAHIYDVHWTMAQHALEQPVVPNTNLHVPDEWTMEMIFEDPSSYIRDVAAMASHERVKWPEFNPKPEVIA